MDFNAWSSPPASAQMLVFGKAENINSNLVITGRVFDLGNQANPGVLAKRYVATLNEVSTREAAHRFADEIIKALGGGLPGISETRIAFISKRSRSRRDLGDGLRRLQSASHHQLPLDFHHAALVSGQYPAGVHQLCVGQSRRFTSSPLKPTGACPSRPIKD